MQDVRKAIFIVITLLAAFALLATSCGNDDDSSDASNREDALGDGSPLGDGSLGIVEVEAGDAIQIRSLQAITGDVAFFGIPIDRATALAIEDYGPIHGFDVDIGASLDDLCSADGGAAAATTVLAEEDVVGVLGTSCSGAAAAAAPLLTNAGLVLISAGNTSPSLTSDLAGNAGENHHVGYFRTAHNDLFQGTAMAKFICKELGLNTAASMHDGDPYTQGLAQAFNDAYENEGCTVTGFTAINKGDTDMVPALTELAAGNPEALVFPLFQPEGDFVAEQYKNVAGLEDTVLVTADALLVDNFMKLPQAENVYITGPDQNFEGNMNESTGRTAAEIAAEYEERYGETATSAFWAHGYDAAVLLLDAIKAASWLEDGSLWIDRQGVRDYLFSVQNYNAIIGNLSCDNFGDCGSSRIAVIQNIGGEENLDASFNNVLFRYAP